MTGKPGSKNDPTNRGGMTREQKDAAELRKLAKATDNWASMGGRGPKKGTKAYNDRVAYVKAALGAVKKEQKAASTQAKMDKQKPPRKKAAPAKPKSSVPPSGGRRRGGPANY